jgi:hypothetical protein
MHIQIRERNKKKKQNKQKKKKGADPNGPTQRPKQPNTAFGPRPGPFSLSPPR